MKRLALNLLAFGVAIICVSAGGNSASAQWQIPISGLPSVSVNPNATLTPGQPTSLGDLITYNPGNTQCEFYDPIQGVVLSTGSCTIVYSVLVIYPGAYTISGEYVNPIDGSFEAVIGGSDPSGALPDYSAITLTPNPGSSGATSIGGFINPQTINYSNGPIGWGGNVQIAPNSCVPSASAGSCNPPPPPPPTCPGYIASLVDPVPDLVSTLSSAPQEIVDIAALTSQGRVVTGVSADGVTQVIVRVRASASGEVLRLTVSGGSPDQYGSIRALTSTTTGTTVDVPATNTPLGPIGFAVYVAPKDFVRPGTNDGSLASRNVAIKIQSLKTNCMLTVPATIVRPPLMLIHGIWSGPQTWVYFGVRANNQLTPLVNDQRFKAYLIDYEDTKGDGFAVNADLVKQEIVQRLDPFTKGSNRQGILVAAVQVDIVAHSMGGDLARTMVTRPNYLSANNYQKGLIHKLITIDTPHLGSEFANRLYNSKQLCKFAWGRSGKKVGDAVRDLQTTSVMITKTLRQKIFPLEASTINGIATPDQAASTQENFQNLKWGLAQAVCPSLLPAGGFAAIFGQDTSDLIVSGKSQEAVGIGYDGGDPPTATSIGLIHTVDSSLFTNGPDALSRNIQNGAVVGVDTVNPQGVIDLLNTPVGTTGFGALLP